MVAKDDNSDRKMHQLLQELLHDPLLSDIASVNEEDKVDLMASTAKPCGQTAQKVDNETVDIMLAQAELMIQAELGGACRVRLEREEHDPIGKETAQQGVSKDVVGLNSATWSKKCNIVFILFFFLQKS